MKSGPALVKWPVLGVAVVWIAVFGWLELVQPDFHADIRVRRAHEKMEQKFKDCWGNFSQRYDCKSALVREHDAQEFYDWAKKLGLVFAPPLALFALYIGFVIIRERKAEAVRRVRRIKRIEKEKEESRIRSIEEGKRRSEEARKKAEEKKREKEGKPKEETSEKPPEQAPETAPEQAPEKAPGQAPETAPEQAPAKEETSEKPPEQAPETAPEQAPAKEETSEKPPEQAPAKAPEQAPEQASVKSEPRRRRVLLIDDDRAAVEAVTKKLAASDIGVAHFPDLEPTLAEFAKSGGDMVIPDMKHTLAEFAKSGGDLVITNVLMGGMGGLKGIKKLRELRSDIKIIAISGGVADKTPETVLAAAKKMGADGVMAKPLDVDKLRDMVLGLGDVPPNVEKCEIGIV